MPHLVEMDKRYRKKGLRILAPEVQGSTKEAIETVIEDNKVEYPIMKGTQRAPNMKGIPHALVFNAAGEVVFEGHPMNEEFDRSIKKALRDVKAEAEDEGGDDFWAKDEPLIPERMWTNTDGKSVTAAVLSVNGENVRLKLKNGRETDYPLSKLSEEDQELIKGAASGEAE